MCAFHGKLHNRQDSCSSTVASSSSAALTEANLEARDFRLEFAQETLQSFKDGRDRSRSPSRTLVDVLKFRIEAQKENIRCKNETIETQKRRISSLEFDVGLKDKIICMKEELTDKMMAIIRDR
jgi:hypothetical protein